MKLILISDTHGGCKRLLDSLVPVFNSADMLVHLGDGADDVERIAHSLTCPVTAVKGNNDFGLDLPDRDFLFLPEGKVMLTHGHRDGVRQGLLGLYLRAAENDCGYVFFGHTHSPQIEIFNGITFVNPGSLGRPYGGKPSYAEIGTDRGQLISKIVYV